MAKEKVVDYETVEKTETITVCDNCGRTDEETDIIDIAINPRFETRDDYELIEVYDDPSAAQRVIDEIKSHQAVNSMRQMGIGRTPKIVGAESDASADLCANCVTEFFGVEIEPEQEVEGVEIDDGEVTVNVTEEAVRNYPTWDFPNEIRYFTIVGWPVIYLFSMLDAIHENEDGWRGKSKPYYFFHVSTGILLWLGVLFMGIVLSMGMFSLPF